LFPATPQKFLLANHSPLAHLQPRAQRDSGSRSSRAAEAHDGSALHLPRSAEEFSVSILDAYFLARFENASFPHLSIEGSHTMAISTRIKIHLEENRVPYSPLTHPSSFTASGAAAVMHVAWREVAKTVSWKQGRSIS
jgi:hypothetical protein